MATTTPIEVDAEIKKYTLVGDDIYLRRYDLNSIPPWFETMINTVIARSGTITDINSMLSYLQNIDDGYAFQLADLSNADQVAYATLESLKASRDDHAAAITTLNLVKVDATAAQAISDTTVASYFNGGNATAWFNDKISTYASEIEVNASNISTLAVGLGEQSLRIDTVEEVTISKAEVLRQATEPTLLTNPGLKNGDIWINAVNNTIHVWNGTSWDDVTSIEAMNATAELATQMSKVQDLEATRDGVIDTYYQTTAPSSGMTYGDYWLDTDSSSSGPFIVYRYEDSNGGSSGVLAWFANTGETARAINAAYVANKNAGTAQATADGKVKTWYQTTAPTGLTSADVGDLWVDTDGGYKVQVWSGTAWVDPTTAQGAQAYTWSANASKLITNPNGQITGWSFGDGTNTKSYFDIYADNFRIVNNTTNAVPFSISGTNVVFNGVVDFTKTNTSGTTTIDGGKITTGTIATAQLNASEIKAGSLFVDNEIKSSDYSLGTSGFRLKANAGGTYDDPTIYGATLRASNIFKGSYYVDTTNTYKGYAVVQSVGFTSSVIADSSTNSCEALSPVVAGFGNNSIATISKRSNVSTTDITVYGVQSFYGQGNNMVITLYLRSYNSTDALSQEVMIQQRAFYVPGATLGTFAFGGTASITIPTDGYVKLYMHATNFSGELHGAPFVISFSNM